MLGQHLTGLGLGLLDDAADLLVDHAVAPGEMVWERATEWPRKTSS